MPVLFCKSAEILLPLAQKHWRTCIAGGFHHNGYTSSSLLVISNMRLWYEMLFQWRPTKNHCRDFHRRATKDLPLKAKSNDLTRVSDGSHIVLQFRCVGKQSMKVEIAWLEIPVANHAPRRHDMMLVAFMIRTNICQKYLRFVLQVLLFQRWQKGQANGQANCSVYTAKMAFAQTLAFNRVSHVIVDL